LVDPDRVELSNLHRQILHRTSTIGTYKVQSAAARLRERFPTLRVDTHAEALTEANLVELFGDADFVVDATDGIDANFSSTMVPCDAGGRSRMPACLASSVRP
jgi:adenylyltransferase/sulfurtransferase